ncbi:MAG: hypothetical protein QM763_22805 [Agriterribacter sp.]
MSNTRKHCKDPFSTQCWLYECVADPYQVIAGFFAEAHVHHFRTFIKKLICHASRADVYKGDSPDDIFLYSKLMRSLIKTAHALRHKKHSAVAIKKDDLFNKKYYRSHYVSADAWQEFPRYLSEKEYSDPYLVFQQFFSYQSLSSWLQCWEQVVENAFCSDSTSITDPLTVCSHLIKLVEAAHLIDVREVMHVGEYVKNGRSLL